MTATVGSSTSRPVTSTSPLQAALPPKLAATPTVSFRSLLLGDTVVRDPLDGHPLAPPPPLVAEQPVVPSTLHGLSDAGKEAEVPPDLGDLVRAVRCRDEETLDSFHRQRAAFGSPEMFSSSGVVVSQPAGAPPSVQATETVRAQTSLEDLLPAMVRRVQWGGDGRKGTVRMELGAGALAGSTLQVSADHGRVSVHLSVPPGVDAAGWHDRIKSRLAAQNIEADHIEVT